MKFLFSLLIFLLPTLSQAQDASNSTPSKLSIKGGFYGNNIHNLGLVGGVDYAIWNKEKYQRNLFNWNEKKLKGNRQILLASDLGFFVDKQTFVGTFFTNGVVFRRTYLNDRDFRIGISPLSVFHSFFAETYKVDENGNIKKQFLPGRTYYAPTLTLGIGRENMKAAKMGWYFDLEMMILSQYNTSILPLISAEFGYRFNFKKQ